MSAVGSKADIALTSCHVALTLGSGKYEGIIITSSAVVPVGPLPQIKEGTMQACNHQKGTYKLK
jgi:hypothetical protein